MSNPDDKPIYVEAMDVIAELKERIAALIALINDNKRAEKVANTHPIIPSLHESNAMEIIREEAITDYRTMLKAALE
uniref:Uncharacterized protein n=1 Tax=viral metagenome TaxID=1070528 RepID=A0A6H2A303_9ZZZZ